jgi:glycosyltransferase involved in cell wall biosynthesis
MIFKNAHINVAPSPYFYSLFHQHGYTNLVAVPNIIETQNYQFKLRETIRPKLLWVRSLALTYNPAMAIRVLANLQQDYPDAELYMVGPDKENLLSSLKKLADDLHVHVTFTGHLSKTEWITMSEEFDIFINTTHLDNTPVSVIEAMALGLPVISTNVGGIPYLLEHGKTALLVSDNDAVEMANAVRTLISDTTLANAITMNSRKLALDFDWHTVKQKWFDILT